MEYGHAEGGDDGGTADSVSPCDDSNDESQHEHSKSAERKHCPQNSYCTWESDQEMVFTLASGESPEESHLCKKPSQET